LLDLKTTNHNFCRFRRFSEFF